MNPDVVTALVRTIELKDQSTAAHTWRVTLYTRALAEALGVEREMIARLTLAAALHDVGKIDIPDAILQKPGRLTDDEFEIIKSHTTLGYDRLVRMGEEDPPMLNLVRHHHERWDGLGYPDGLVGEQIPLGARYFSVIDTFDALTSVRPYRREIGAEAAEKAIAEIERGIDSRYAEDPARAFIDLYRSGDIDWILHYYNDNASLPTLPHEAPPPRTGELPG
jgi:putative nucleotidyltransferase with HDIG domain